MLRTIIPHVVRDQVIHSLPETATALEAARLMEAANIGAVVVLDGAGVLRGIVTERDLVRRVLAVRQPREVVILSQVMSRDPDTLLPGDTAGDALELMQSRGFRHLPVVDDAGRVIGMVSVRDLYAAVKTTLEEDVREAEAFVFGDRYAASV